MFKAAIAEPVPNYEERRTSTRYAVHIEAILHANGKSQPTLIDDLSLSLIRLNGAIGIYANEDVEVELPDGRRLGAKVAWWLSGCCGVQFNKPLPSNDPIFAAVKK